MRVLVTGSSGHLGEALMRTFELGEHDVAGLDLLESPFTHYVGSVADAHFVRDSMRGVDVVIHTATLHKPHVATHSRQAFVETNVTGTLNILEAALDAGVSGVVFTSTTSVFGGALIPDEGEPAAWITEEVEPVPKNIYGVTKRSAEDLCQLFYRTKGLPSIALRTSRFFPEMDDNPESRLNFDDTNLKANEFLYRRLDLADAVDAHLLAAERVIDIGFGRYLLSATAPFEPEHLLQLRQDLPGAVRSLYPECDEVYRLHDWKLPSGIDRVYVNHRAQEELGWKPQFNFRRILECLQRGDDVFSPLTREVGKKGYHSESFSVGPYPVETETPDRS